MTIATIQTKDVFFFFVFDFELTPFSDGQLSKIKLDPPFSTGNILSANPHSSSTYNPLSLKLECADIMSKINRVLYISERREMMANQHQNHCNMRS